MAEEINQELGEMSQVLSTIITDVNRNIIKSPVGDELNGNQDDKEYIEDPVSYLIFHSLLMKCCPILLINFFILDG